MNESTTLDQIDQLTETERRQALSDRLKEIADQIASRSTDDERPNLANIASTCPTDPAELAMCDSCQ